MTVGGERERANDHARAPDENYPQKYAVTKKMRDGARCGHSSGPMASLPRAYGDNFHANDVRRPQHRATVCVCICSMQSVVAVVLRFCGVARSNVVNSHNVSSVRGSPMWPDVWVVCGCLHLMCCTIYYIKLIL